MSILTLTDHWATPPAPTPSWAAIRELVASAEATGVYEGGALRNSGGYPQGQPSATGSAGGRQSSSTSVEGESNTHGVHATPAPTSPDHDLLASSDACAKLLDRVQHLETENAYLIRTTAELRQRILQVIPPPCNMY